MASILFKWLILAISCFGLNEPGLHPIYVSVTEIEHNPKDKSLEISCRIFTDDFEKTLRKTTHITVDLLSPKDKSAMDKLISQYVQQHLKIMVDGKPVSLKYIGYEQVEEAIESYYQVPDIPSVKNITVQDNLLFEYSPQQISIIHVTVNGNRKSTKLNQPEDQVNFRF